MPRFDSVNANVSHVVIEGETYEGQDCVTVRAYDFGERTLAEAHVSLAEITSKLTGNGNHVEMRCVGDKGVLKIYPTTGVGSDKPLDTIVFPGASSLRVSIQQSDNFRDALSHEAEASEARD